MQVKIIDDVILSNNEGTCKRFTTFYLQDIPRYILPMINKHRVFSNVAQSNRYCNRLTDALFKQVYPTGISLFGKILFRIGCLFSCLLFVLGKKFINKELLNRLLEPFIGIDLYIGSFEYMNFFKLRTSKSADPSIRELAQRMKKAYYDSDPVLAEVSLPTVTKEERQTYGYKDCIYISAARIARVSHKSIAKTPIDDLKLGLQLVEWGHLVPFEFINTIDGNARQYFENKTKVL